MSLLGNRVSPYDQEDDHDVLLQRQGFVKLQPNPKLIVNIHKRIIPIQIDTAPLVPECGETAIEAYPDPTWRHSVETDM